ncbi:hypothetical protein DY000_02059384 [Brassica cretica]|uniref:FPL domain-containing protein n=1 Tax=Brassica cretica TaxID=69181 RepID=A0ABQ7AXT5_BRACR|nr:hypothetical protein DY000_02059384 [Brassica cretica]
MKKQRLSPPLSINSNQSAVIDARHLTELRKIQIVNDTNKDFVFEALRSIAEILTYGNHHDPSFFEFFLEKQVMGEFVRILRATASLAMASSDLRRPPKRLRTPMLSEVRESTAFPRYTCYVFQQRSRLSYSSSAVTCGLLQFLMISSFHPMKEDALYIYNSHSHLRFLSCRRVVVNVKMYSPNSRAEDFPRLLPFGLAHNCVEVSSQNMYHYKKTAAYRGKNSSVCRRNNVIPTTYRRNKSSEITPRKLIFPRKSLGNFRRNSEELNFRGNSEDHQFVGKVLGIYQGRTSSGYFDGLSDVTVLGSSDEMFLGIFIGKFPGTEPSENSEECVRRYIPRNVPRNLHREMPRNGALGKFRRMCPSVYSEEFVPRYIPRNLSLGIFRGNVRRKFPRVHFLGISKINNFFK